MVCSLRVSSYFIPKTFMANFIDSKRIDISELSRAGVFRHSKLVTLSWNNSFIHRKEFENQVFVKKVEGHDIVEIGYLMLGKYDDTERYLYPVKLTRVNSNLGGFRYYFLCPLSINGIPCRKRVFVLYKPDNEIFFGCRHCHEIKYPTQAFNQKSSVYSEVKRQIIENKIESLESEARLSSYKGKKTKKQTRLEKLYREAEKYPSFFYHNIR